MRFISAGSIPRPTKLHSPIDYLYQNKPREVYIEVAKNLGVSDICECTVTGGIFNLNPEVRFRKNSGNVGMKECVDCGLLRYPLMHMYDCDNCCEPTLSPVHPLSNDVIFLCCYCSGNSSI